MYHESYHNPLPRWIRVCKTMIHLKNMHMTQLISYKLISQIAFQYSGTVLFFKINICICEITIAFLFPMLFADFPFLTFILASLFAHFQFCLLNISSCTTLVVTPALHQVFTFWNPHFTFQILKSTFLFWQNPFCWIHKNHFSIFKFHFWTFGNESFFIFQNLFSTSGNQESTFQLFNPLLTFLESDASFSISSSYCWNSLSRILFSTPHFRQLTFWLFLL